MQLGPLPETFAGTRDVVQRVAAHVLARRRHQLCGKFGLRAVPGGIGTPACGPEHEVVRTSGTWLIRDRTGSSSRTTLLDLATATLAEAAALADADLAAAFSVGHDTPPLGDTNAVLGVDRAAAQALGDWFSFGAVVLDAAVAQLGPAAEPSVVQLWPEHFDIAGDVAAASGRRANLGASPGDSFSPQPYLYVGPWDADRPGDPAYWNAPFGAVLEYDRLRAAADPVTDAVAFLGRGISLL
jgi:hypothetical protein